jgi:hypothetical protein
LSLPAFEQQKKAEILRIQKEDFTLPSKNQHLPASEILLHEDLSQLMQAQVKPLLNNEP